MDFRYNYLLLALLLFIGFSAQAQIEWTGGGDGTSWQDANNWMPNMVPPADSIALFKTSATITGTAAVAPKRVTVAGSGVAVTLDLDLTVGNGVEEEHTVVVNSGSTLTLGGGTASRTFTLNPSPTKNGLTTFAAFDSTTVNISANTTVVISAGTNGMSFPNTNGWVTNNGTISMGSAVKNGIKSAVAFTNNGTINLTNQGNDALVVQGGTFTNSNSGIIKAEKPNDDCLEIIMDGEFVNDGSLNLSAKDDAGTANNGIVVGMDVTSGGTFINLTKGLVSVSGGGTTNGRAIFVHELGSMKNSGTIETTGAADAGGRYYNRGTTTNDLGGVLDLTDGRANVNKGSFTNNGLLVSTRQGSGVFCDTLTTVNNNGFYSYNMSGLFAAGSGDRINKGIDLNDPAQTAIDAAGACMVDIAEAPYTWFEGGDEVTTADASGLLTFPTMSISANSVALTTNLPGVTIQVDNVCADAVMTSSVFNRPNSDNSLKIIPSLLEHHTEIAVYFPFSSEKPVSDIFIFNTNGELVQRIPFSGNNVQTIQVQHLNSGEYILYSQSGNTKYFGRFVVIK